MSVCAINLALCGLQVKWFGVMMCNKTRIKKTISRKRKKGSRYRRRNSTTSLRILYTLILFGDFILAGIALFLRIEAPGVWAFLSGIGSLALTNILRGNLK